MYMHGYTYIGRECCHGLNMNYFPLVQVLNPWFLTSGAILGNVVNFRRLDLSGRTRTVEVYQFPTLSVYKEQIIKAHASQSLAWRSQVCKQHTEFSTSALRHGKSGLGHIRAPRWANSQVDII